MLRAQTWYVPALLRLSGVTPLAHSAKQLASAPQPSMHLVRVSQPLAALQAEAALAHVVSAQARHAFVSMPEADDAPPAPLRFTHTLLLQSRPALQVLLA
jgi:hypothetical protein